VDVLNIADDKTFVDVLQRLWARMVFKNLYRFATGIAETGVSGKLFAICGLIFKIKNACHEPLHRAIVYLSVIVL
jgi:hypothetical protein